MYLGRPGRSVCLRGLGACRRFVIEIYFVRVRVPTRQTPPPFGTFSSLFSTTTTTSSIMAPLTVKIKHAGKVHELPLDPDQPATVFKDAVYQLTGVPPDRMKVMIKGGVLKVSTL